MTVKYIGRKATYQGKFLFHLLCNSRDFGKGRMVIRDSFNKRYPEPSYFIIHRAEPDMTDPQLKKGTAWATKVFRGEKYDGQQKIEAGFRPDWRLVPKHFEYKYLNIESTSPRMYNEVPYTVRFPPLFEDMVVQAIKDSGQEVTSPPPLKLVLNTGSNNRIKTSE